LSVPSISDTIRKLLKSFFINASIVINYFVLILLCH
jgi:hypothetical protein